MKQPFYIANQEAYDEYIQKVIKRGTCKKTIKLDVGYPPLYLKSAGAVETSHGKRVTLIDLGDDCDGNGNSASERVSSSRLG